MVIGVQIEAAILEPLFRLMLRLTSTIYTDVDLMTITVVMPLTDV